MNNFSEKDTIIMKLLHYFMTNKNYNPIVLHGIDNEIWLENMDEEYKVIRIVSRYIHNDEQLKFDLYRANKIRNNIKRKTLNFKMKVLSIYIDLGDNASLLPYKDIDSIYLTDEKDLKKYKFIYEYYPDIDKKLKFTEEGINLFIKITNDINKRNKKQSEQVEKIFKKKKPYITYILMFINIFIFVIGFLSLRHYEILNRFCIESESIRAGQYYRLLTGTFLHSSLLHLIFNMYALYIIGREVESLYGKAKYTVIYFVSAISGSLLSMLLNINSASVGASGAIFGLLGSLLYFGYNYRAYLGNGLIKDVLPIIIFNLFLGFVLTGVDNFGHIGGLVGGILSSMALSVNGKENNNDKINGIIFIILFIIFMIYMNFFR